MAGAGAASFLGLHLNKAPEEITPAWRTVPSGVHLMNLKGVAKTQSATIVSLVDLLFFPTGGVKTEAISWMAAFNVGVAAVAVNPGLMVGGVSVLNAVHTFDLDV